ncbi:M1 family aminopeptidase [Tundrisphaera lichenicola]|uniref:M1 family metallopeptidase n=1 Tax=Tundrisphaera lichenicola TaxID=2029860 RepID=UPI003EB7F36F
MTELVFHVYPRHRVEDGDRPMVSKTLEVLRLSPEEAMDAEGRRLEVAEARVEGRPVAVAFDPKNDTVMMLPLAEPIVPGKSVEAEIDFSVELPDKWGRWGQHKGVTYLLNWYPVLAHVDDRGWEHTPFVPWHQPWHQEAGLYTVRLDLPANQVVASSGRIMEARNLGPGRQSLTIVASPARDFAMVCSDRFEVHERKANEVMVRVVGFPEDRANLAKALDFACEVIPQYEKWFGPYFDEEFEIATSFFGWNGNECSGLVLLDDRVMRLPEAGHRYIEHLVTHETLHQWFWNVVGTDGYAETFMDEGIVNALTSRRLDEKHGKNAPLIVWQKGLNWLPTIGREDLRLSSYYGWRARGNGGSAIQNLDEMGNLGAVFSLAYDRGGKVIDMIENRLGSERFFEFLSKIYRDYAWKTISYADFRRELIAFDHSVDWGDFLDGWLIEHRDLDWSVEKVDVGKPTGWEAQTPVTIRLRQRGVMLEPTVVMCKVGDDEIRVPIWTDRGNYDVPGARVDRVGDDWFVSLQAPGRPTQVVVDPDHALLDAVPDNNRWKSEIAWRVTPLMTPLDESSQFQAFDRVSVVGGLFVDQYERGGVKASVQRLDKFQLTAWAGTEPALREAIFGGQIVFPHRPWPKWSSGFFYEEGLYNFYNDRQHSGGRLFTRYKFLEASSFLVDDAGFAELYYGFGNEFWAGDDGRPVSKPFAALGGRFRLSTLFPVWNPVGGKLIEATLEYGDRIFGSTFDYTRMTLDLGTVRPLPEGMGWFSKTRVAVRGYGGLGFPDNVAYFRLGGGRRLRALDLSQNIGSSVWLGTLEWRFPIVENLDRDMLDHVVSGRNITGAVFYDVGQSYLRGKFSPVINGIGLSLGLDVALFSFLERAVLRVDLAQPIIAGRGPVLWFGLNQVF